MCIRISMVSRSRLNPCNVTMDCANKMILIIARVARSQKNQIALRNSSVAVLGNVRMDAVSKVSVQFRNYLLMDILTLRFIECRASS